MSAVNWAGRKAMDAVNWVSEHKGELVTGVGCLALFGLRCYFEQLSIDAELNFRTRCLEDSLPLVERNVVDGSLRYVTLQCGTRLFCKLF